MARFASQIGVQNAPVLHEAQVMGCVLYGCTYSDGDLTDRQIVLGKRPEDQNAFGIGKDLADLSLLFCRLERLIGRRYVHLFRLLELSEFPILRKHKTRSSHLLVKVVTIVIGINDSWL